MENLPIRETTPWTVGEALSFAWAREKGDFLTVILTSAAAYCISAVPATASSVYTIGTFVSTLDLDALTNDLAGGSVLPVEPLGVRIAGYLATLIGMVTSAVMVGGLSRYSLLVARGEPAGFGDLFTGQRAFFPTMLRFTIIVELPVAVALALLDVPGLVPPTASFGLQLAIPILFSVVIFGACLAPTLIVDRQLDAIAAMRASFGLVAQAIGRLTVLSLIIMVLSTIGFCACGLGWFVAAPLWTLALAYVYLRMTDQPTAEVMITER